MAVGLAAGMGSGIAIGVPTGIKQAREKVRDHFESEGLTIRDADGRPVAIDDALNSALAARAPSGQRVLIAVGLAITLALGVVVYFLMAQR